MERLEKILSRPAAKPYRTRNLEKNEKVTLDPNGYLAFAPGDIENPKNWSKTRRWYVCSVAVLLVVNATFASSSPSGSIESISEHFGTSIEVSALVITLFLLGYVFGPLFWAPLSENYGRRWCFVASFSLYNIFNFLCAFAPNFAGLLIGRLITGVAASAALSNSPGVLADVFNPQERANAMALFSFATFLGPALGPILAAATPSWQWSFYILLWLGGASQILLFTVPETYAPTILLRKAKRLRASGEPAYASLKAPVEGSGRTIGSLFKVALTRPWRILLDPISVLIAIYLSVVYALLYLLFTLYPLIFREKRGFSIFIGELPLLGVIIGAGIATLIIFWQTRRDQKLLDSGHKMTPEDRLPVAKIGGIIFPLSMLWFAWSGHYVSVPWYVPALAGVALSISILLIFVSWLNYIADVYVQYAASAIAANTVCRSACGAAAPLFATYMFSDSGLGIGPGGSLIAGIGLCLMPIPFLFAKYGSKIRARSKFAPTEGGAGPSIPQQGTASRLERGGGSSNDDEMSRTSSSTAHHHADDDDDTTSEHAAVGRKDPTTGLVDVDLTNPGNDAMEGVSSTPNATESARVCQRNDHGRKIDIHGAAKRTTAVEATRST